MTKENQIKLYKHFLATEQEDRAKAMLTPVFLKKYPDFEKEVEASNNTKKSKKK